MYAVILNSQGIIPEEILLKNSENPFNIALNILLQPPYTLIIFILHLVLKKYDIPIINEIIYEKAVAQAAPEIPNFNTTINNASNIILNKDEMININDANFGEPLSLIN